MCFVGKREREMLVVKKKTPRWQETEAADGRGTERRSVGRDKCLAGGGQRKTFTYRGRNRDISSADRETRMFRDREKCLVCDG